MCGWIVICFGIGQHGWWHCSDLEMPGYDPFDADGSNYNLTLDPTNCDPISGTPEHRASLCQTWSSTRGPGQPGAKPTGDVGPISHSVKASLVHTMN